jgi:hypothetical protein
MGVSPSFQAHVVLCADFRDPCVRLFSFCMTAAEKTIWGGMEHEVRRFGHGLLTDLLTSVCHCSSRGWDSRVSVNPVTPDPVLGPLGHPLLTAAERFLSLFPTCHAMTPRVVLLGIHGTGDRELSFPATSIRFVISQGFSNPNPEVVGGKV